MSSEAERPWPAPREPWIFTQSWVKLLFAHWPVPATALRALVPGGLELQEHGGSAWLGMAAFRLEGLRLRAAPPAPGLSRFLELNLRTYVSAGGKPGVWFFSLDAASLPAVMGARLLYRLPYHHARMQLAERDGWIDYRSVRRRGSAAFSGSYRAAGSVFRATPGTLEHFLVERYCLYAAGSSGQLLRAEIDHAPWPLQPAEARIEHNSVARASGIELPAVEPLLHFAARIDTRTWLPARVR